MLCCMAPPTYSQNPDSILQTHDSVVLSTPDSGKVTIPTTAITAPADYTIFGIKLPSWANLIITVLLAIMALLPGIQLVLKKIPGAEPIDGVLGKILDALTWFQKNILKE